MATKVTVRQKPISDNRQSLYLDFYPAIPHPETGKATRREFLGLYVYAETFIDKQGKERKVKLNPADKEHNKETLALAEDIRSKRQLDIQKGQFGFLSDRKRNADFVQYFKSIADKRNGSNYDNWTSASYYLQDFTGGTLRFADLTTAWCNDFKEYLLTAPSRKSEKVSLSTNSALSYFNKVKAAMKQAFKDGILETDLNAKVKTIKAAETHRQYLTVSELETLAKTPCPLPEVWKKASLFSALTGLRFSDINKLVWGEIQQTENGFQIKFIQKKTKGAEYLQISEQAYSLLGESGKSKDLVFPGLDYSAYNNKLLMQWVKTAKINKHITFHCFRHTYATILLSKGVDLYTVSKMLGHREVKTTQIYTKVINENKRKAADTMNFNF